MTDEPRRPAGPPKLTATVVLPPAAPPATLSGAPTLARTVALAGQPADGERTVVLDAAQAPPAPPRLEATLALAPTPPSPGAPLERASALAGTLDAPPPSATAAASAPGGPAGRPAGALERGSRVGDLVLLDKLGQGAMGAVFLAEHTQTGGRYAVKLLSSLADPQELERFRREGLAQAAADAHPNVARIHSTGEALGHRYLVMDVLPGGDLEQRLRQGPLASLEAVRLVAALARGLAHAHARGILHRDLKPANVMFDEHGTPKLVDFGIARIAGEDRMTVTGALLGSPAYMSPEQASGERKRVEERTDVYGLGGILYTALTGGFPFEAQSVPAMLKAIMTDPLTPPSARARGVDPRVDAVVLRAMAKEPEQRHPSARELANDLDALAARLAAGPDREPRARVPAAAAGLVALLAAAAASAGTWLATRPGPEPAKPPPVTKQTERPPPPRPAAKRPGPEVLPGGVKHTPEQGFFLEAGGLRIPLCWIPPPPPEGFDLGVPLPDGSSDTDLGPEVLLTYAAPPRRVRLRGFFMATYELTRAEAVVARLSPPTDGHFETADGTPCPPTGRHPMTGLTWQQARDACERLGGRLPTEAEWEWAARHGRPGRYPWGDEPREGGSSGRRAAPLRPTRDDGAQPSLPPVGTYPRGATREGVHDLSGSVWEWVDDVFLPYAVHGDVGVAELDPRVERSNADRVTPQVLEAHRVLGFHPDPGRRVLRGGAFTTKKDADHKTRVFHRHPWQAADGASDQGVRLVVSGAE